MHERSGGRLLAALRRLAAAASAGLIVGCLGAPAHATTVERIVAVVADRPILLSDLRQRALPMLLRIHGELPAGAQRAAAISQLYKQMLDRMVDEELERLAAMRSEVSVTAREIEAAIGRVAKSQGITGEMLLAEAAKMGLSATDYRAELRRQLLESKLMNLRLQGRIRITEDELRASYQQLQIEERAKQPFTARWIVLRGAGAAPGAGNEASARRLRVRRELAASIVSRARSGESFEALASKYSEDPETRARGGFMGQLDPSQLPAELRALAVKLEPGGVSIPLRLRGDLIIVQVVDRPESQLPTFAEAKAELTNRVYMEKMTKARRVWLDGLRKREHVDVRL